MKKIIAFGLSAIMSFTFAGSVAFAASQPALPTPEYIETDRDTADVDVEGRITTWSAYQDEINVSVPVSILWFAFAEGNNAVESPSYQIKNWNTTNSIEVSLNSFNKKATDVDHDKIESGKLTLTMNLSNPSSSQVNIFSSNAFMAAATLLDTLAPAADDANPSTLDFEIGGSYFGGYDKTLTPKYDMQFAFALPAQP